VGKQHISPGLDEKGNHFGVAMSALHISNSFQNWVIKDHRRLVSREIDFGVNWTLTGKERWPHWRVSWIEETGELYAVEMTESTGANKRRFVALATIPSLEEVELALTNWADPDCPFNNNLTELHMRLQNGT